MMQINLPEQFLGSMRELLGDEYDAWLASYGHSPSQGLRINRTKIGPQEWEGGLSPFTTEKVPWCDNGYYCPEDVRPAKHPYYYAGLYYIQEPSAMAPAQFLPVAPGDAVLDLCAAPGGKSTELGAELYGEGLLVSNDISNSRARALLKNLELFGIPNICVTSETPQKLADTFGAFFDKILVDAPCSGEGMFRKDPDLIKSWLEHGPGYYAPIQRDILFQAVRMLKPGGYLLYSTCTFAKAEDEDTVDWILQNAPEMELAALPGGRWDGRRVGPGMDAEGYSAGGGDAEGCGIGSGDADSGGMGGGNADGIRKSIDGRPMMRFFPHKVRGEGHFLALLHKKITAGCPADSVNQAIGKSGKKRPGTGRHGAGMPDAGMPGTGKSSSGRSGSGNPDAGKPDASIRKLEAESDFKEWEAMLGRPLCRDRMMVKDGLVYYLPELFDPNWNLRYLRTGLLLGEWKKKRFEPSQALAMVLQQGEFRNNISFSCGDDRTLRYLKGETIPLTEEEQGRTKKGWCLICVDGYPLGWAKCTGSTLKNKYYPGWRWQ